MKFLSKTVLLCLLFFLLEAAFTSAVKAAEDELGESGRILLRPSGTEPLIRVMVEGENASQIENLASSLASKVETAIQAGI